MLDVTIAVNMKPCERMSKLYRVVQTIKEANTPDKWTSQDRKEFAEAIADAEMRADVSAVSS